VYHESMECSSCGAVYSNVLLSESEFTQGGCKVLEIGFTADITVTVPQEAPQIESDSAFDFCDIREQDPNHAAILVEKAEAMV